MRRRLAPERLGSVDVRLLPKPEHFRPHDAAGGEPAGGADQQDQRQHRHPLPHRQDEQQHKQARDGERAINQPHQCRIDQCRPR